MLGKLFSRRLFVFLFLIFPENRNITFMQIVRFCFGKNKKNLISLSSAESAHSLVNFEMLSKECMFAYNVIVT